MRFHKFDAKTQIANTALNATNELLKKHGLHPSQKDVLDVMDFGCIPDTIDLAKEAIKRKESIEPRMPRAK